MKNDDLILKRGDVLAPSLALNPTPTPHPFLSTPPKLMATLDAVLSAYDAAARRAASPAARAVVAQLPPDTVNRLRRVRAMVNKEFM